MSEVTIYGASDDLIDVEGDCPGCDEYNAEDATFVVQCTTGTARVRVRYTDDGVWAIECSQVDETIPLPPVSLTSETYSARAVIGDVKLVVRDGGGS